MGAQAFFYLLLVNEDVWLLNLILYACYVKPIYVSSFIMIGCDCRLVDECLLLAAAV